MMMELFNLNLKFSANLFLLLIIAKNVCFEKPTFHAAILCVIVTRRATEEAQRATEENNLRSAKS